jgi:iron complex outermembrane receptor protein
VLTYKTGRWEFDVRSIYFGKAAHIFSGADRSRDEFFNPKFLTGFSIGYSVKPQLTVKAGARNIFDVYPDKVKNRLNTQAGLVVYDFNGTPIGYNGGYYFVNMNLTW